MSHAIESHKRTLAKTLSWRIWATLITTAVAWLWTGHLGLAFAVGGTEAIIKMFAYYLHERAWSNIKLGYIVSKPPELVVFENEDFSEGHSADTSLERQSCVASDCGLRNVL